MSARRSGALSEAELAEVCVFLYRRTGLVYGETKRYYTERRVAQRMDAAGIQDFGGYLATLRGDPAEAEALINAFTVNETYFYREKHQLQSLSGAVLPAIAAGKAPGDRIRIWSLPCSTGEEVYSIAIWLLENWSAVDAYNVEIVGSDLDTQALRAAAEGVYGERAVSRLPMELRSRYLERRDGERWEVIDDLKESVRFSRANIVDAASMAREGTFEVIFCRNLLIYFDDASRALAVDHLHDALRPGGVVCLGHSESMSRTNGLFSTWRLDEGVVYRRMEVAP